MSAKITRKDLLFIELMNLYINHVDTFVCSKQFYIDIVKYGLIDSLTFNLIVKNECKR